MIQGPHSSRALCLLPGEAFAEATLSLVHVRSSPPITLRLPHSAPIAVRHAIAAHRRVVHMCKAFPTCCCYPPILQFMQGTSPPTEFLRL